MKILICENEKDLATGLTIILKKNNFNVDLAYDGDECLSYVEVYKYDVIILDLMLPKINGIEVLKKIREKNINYPVIILSALSSTEDIVKCLDLGANDYVTKPFSTAELLARIRVITRSNSSSYDSNIKFGDLTLNRITFEISNTKDKIRLTNKEYQILELLMSSTAYIKTEQMMERIWDIDSDSEINVVWSYISMLRSKLKKMNSNVKISVSRNLGYYLEVEDGN